MAEKRPLMDRVWASLRNSKAHACQLKFPFSLLPCGQRIADWTDCLLRCMCPRLMWWTAPAPGIEVP